jgi:hypothetical protein
MASMISRSAEVLEFQNICDIYGLPHTAITIRSDVQSLNWIDLYGVVLNGKIDRSFWCSGNVSNLQ